MLHKTGELLVSVSSTRERIHELKVHHELLLLKTFLKESPNPEQTMPNDWKMLTSYAHAVQEICSLVKELFRGFNGTKRECYVLPVLMEYQSLALTLQILLRCIQRVVFLRQNRTEHYSNRHGQLKQDSVQTGSAITEALENIISLISITGPAKWMIQCAPGFLSTLPKIAFSKHVVKTEASFLIQCIAVILEKSLENVEERTETDGSTFLGPFPKDVLRKALSPLFVSSESQDCGLVLEVIKKQTSGGILLHLCRIFHTILKVQYGKDATVPDYDINRESSFDAEDLTKAIKAFDFGKATNGAPSHHDLNIFGRNALHSFSVFFYVQERVNGKDTMNHQYTKSLIANTRTLRIFYRAIRDMQECCETLSSEFECESLVDEKITLFTSLLYLDSKIEEKLKCCYHTHDVKYCIDEKLIQNLLCWYIQSSTTQLFSEDTRMQYFEVNTFSFHQVTALHCLFFAGAEKVLKCCLKNLSDIDLCYALHKPSLDILIVFASGFHSESGILPKCDLSWNIWIDTIEQFCHRFPHLWALDVPSDIFGSACSADSCENYSPHEKNHKLTILLLVIKLCGIVSEKLNSSDTIPPRLKERHRRDLVRCVVPQVAPLLQCVIEDVQKAAYQTLHSISENIPLHEFLTSNSNIILETIKNQLLHPYLYPSAHFNFVSFVQVVLYGQTKDKENHILSSVRAIDHHKATIQKVLAERNELQITPANQTFPSLVHLIGGILRLALFRVSEADPGMVVCYLTVLCTLAEYFFTVSVLNLKDSRSASNNDDFKSEENDMRSLWIAQLRLWACFHSFFDHGEQSIRGMARQGILHCMFSFFTTEAKLGDPVTLSTAGTSASVFIHNNALPSIHETWTKNFQSLKLLFFEADIQHSDITAIVFLYKQALVLQETNCTAFTETQQIHSDVVAFLMQKVPILEDGDNTKSSVEHLRSLSTCNLNFKNLQKKLRFNVGFPRLSLPFFDLLLSCCQAAPKFLENRARGYFFDFAEVVCLAMAYNHESIFDRSSLKGVHSIIIKMIRIYEEELWQYYSSTLDEKEIQSDWETCQKIACIRIAISIMGDLSS